MSAALIAQWLTSVDRSSFYEEDPARRRGLKHPSRRTGVPRKASGGLCAPLPSRAS